MKKYILSIIVLLIGLNLAFTQDTTAVVKEKDVPVVAPFESGILIDNQTCVIPPAKTLEFMIQHRFGDLGYDTALHNNGFHELYGLYASANIRLGLNYSIMDNLMVGYGITKTNMYSDFQVKYAVLQQTRKNTVPVAVTLYGNMAIDGRNKTTFEGVGADSAYSFSNRLSYFGQLIVGRKFNDWFSVQATTSFTHYNKVAGGLDHDKIGIGFNGRVKFSPQSSVIFQFDAPLKIKGITEQANFDEMDQQNPNVAIGYEVSTGTHAFQIFISNTDGIVPQQNYMYNQEDWKKISNWRFGFVMTRLWGF
jgi:hypothetical protein